MSSIQSMYTHTYISILGCGNVWGGALFFYHQHIHIYIHTYTNVYIHIYAKRKILKIHVITLIVGGFFLDSKTLGVILKKPK